MTPSPNTTRTASCPSSLIFTANGTGGTSQACEYAFNFFRLKPNSSSLSVRATYVTPKERFKVSKEFLEDIDAAAGDHRVPGKPPIFQVTADKFIPTLLESELEKIDNTVARGSTSKKRTGKGVRDQVLGTKEDRPEVSKAFKQTNMRQCAYCEEPKELKNLSLCSRYVVCLRSLDNA